MLNLFAVQAAVKTEQAGRRASAAWMAGQQQLAARRAEAERRAMGALTLNQR